MADRNLFRYSVSKQTVNNSCFDEKLRLSRIARVELHGVSEKEEYIQFGFGIPISDAKTSDTIDDGPATIVPLRITVEYLMVSSAVTLEHLTIDLPNPVNRFNNTGQYADSGDN